MQKKKNPTAVQKIDMRFRSEGPDIQVRITECLLYSPASNQPIEMRSGYNFRAG